jgi:uncharacterized protein YbjT (DUF2867 family)
MGTLNALIAGATGLVGNQLLELLLSDESYSKVVILVRKPITMDHPKLIQILVDYDQLESLLLPVDVNHAFCALGTTIKTAGSQDAFRKVDHDYVVNLGKFCEKNGVQKFLVVSAMGADSSSGIFYNRVKGEMEVAIRQLSIPTVAIFRPSLLMGKRKDFRFGEKFAQAVMGALGFLFVGTLKKYKGIPAIIVAKAMIQTALKGKESHQVLNSAEIWNCTSIAR